LNNLIEIKNLSFYYDKSVVLDEVNLDIKPNDYLAIIGPNGGGKSTLLKLSPKTGVINSTYDKNAIGYVPQNTNLNINFPITALEVVLMGHIGGKRPLFGYSKEEVTCAKNSLGKVGMGDFEDTKIGNLSGGQRQRVFISRALCANPKIMLLDEPTASIDVQGQTEVYELLKELNKTISIVVVSHDISVLLNYAKNVAHVNKNLVYHSLENVQKNVQPNNEHLCEVELLAALGTTSSCGCNHEH
jgi:zinc transport system ATP-binding protein